MKVCLLLCRENSDIKKAKFSYVFLHQVSLKTSPEQRYLTQAGEKRNQEYSCKVDVSKKKDNFEELHIAVDETIQSNSINIWQLHLKTHE